MAETEEKHDVVVIGGGPAGLTAAIYASRAGLDVFVLEQGFPGGQIAITDFLENFPGFPDGISGADFAEKIAEQARKFGAKIVTDEAAAVDPAEGLWRVAGSESAYAAKAVIVASGSAPRKMGVPGEEKLIGRGISFCATCDAPFFREKRIAVVGGGNSAMKEALYLAKFASEVFVVHRRNALRAEKIVQERAFANPKIRFVWDSVIEAVRGEGGVEAILLKNVKTIETSDLPVKGVFVFIGSTPRTSFLRGIVSLDEAGYVKTDALMRASAPGIFAAGDVRVTGLRQVVTACGDGAMAAKAAEEYINS